MPYGLLDEEENKLKMPVYRDVSSFSFGDTPITSAIEKNAVRIQPAEKSDAELTSEYIKRKYLDDKAELEAAKEDSRQRRMGVGILDAISSGLQTVTGAKAPKYDMAYAGAQQPVEDVRESQKNWKSNPNDPRNIAYKQMLGKNPELAAQLKSGGVDVDNFTLGGYEEFSPLHKEMFGLQKSKNDFNEKLKLAGIQATAAEDVKIRAENRKERKRLDQDYQTWDALEKQIDDAMAAAKNYNSGYGPGTGVVAKMKTAAGSLSPETQALNTALNKLSLDQMVKQFSGMSKAIDTPAERAAFESTVPSVGMDNELLMQELMNRKNAAKKAKERIRSGAAQFDKYGEFVNEAEAQQKSVVKKEYSKSKNQTRLTFSDGSTQIVEGKQ